MLAQAMDFPPNYTNVFMERQRRFLKCKRDPSLKGGAWEYYKTRPAEFISDWGVTYDPRNIATGLPTILPFILFPRQIEFINFLYDCFNDQEAGLVEKCRDMGATWCCAAFSVWLWLFHEGSSVGWGSRKETLVDKLGDPDSIFEKIRIFISFLPPWLKPDEYNEKNHSSYMRIINPANGSTITGEAGDNIGRGGRKTIYFKDESAHYERPEKIEAALADNTNVQIDISSVNGHANIFARRRQSGELWVKDKKIASGKTRVFIFDWRDHPLKTQEWHDERQVKAEREGLSHIFAQEVERDYAAAVEGVVIPAIWVKAAIDAHKVLGFKIEGTKVAGLDVADEGGDKNAYTARKGVVCFHSESWGEGDTGESTKKCVRLMTSFGCLELQYDCIGVGAGIKASANLLKKSAKASNFINKIKFVKWNAASSPLFKEQRVVKGDKDTPKNKDFYSGLKAQAWWNVRLMFERTYKAVVKKEIYDFDQLISIKSDIPNLNSLVQQLSQPTYSTNNAGKIVIDKQPKGTTSPNEGDSFVICYWPIKNKKVLI